MSPDSILQQFAAKKDAAAERKRAFAAPVPGKVRAIDPARLVGVVAPSAFTCESVWRVFHALTFEWSTADRETTWLALIHRLKGETYQYLFTEEDWHHIYTEFAQ